MNEVTLIYKFLGYIAVAGNVIFFLWILYNGINEGFQGTRPEIVSYIGLMILLLLNAFLIYVYGRQRKNLI
ncbi:MAG: hypothetical protein HYT20_03340 [Candidatus Nealsonbacteria bacterium]|nr:hypothetical protein [Candidatus Nealsonbacteria bacterium]